jgi:methionyl-tRNA formyltransferase
MIAAYWRDVGPVPFGHELSVERINERAALDHLTSLKPDVIFAHCIHQYFSHKLRAVPRLGTFMWHTGIMPEYRGLYSPFWALHNLDFGNLGYSLFQMTKSIDAGDVYVQGRISNVDVLRDNHTHISHKAMFASFPDVANFINELERGTARPLQRTGALPRYYTYPGITDYVRQRRRIHRYLREQHGNATLVQG